MSHPGVGAVDRFLQTDSISTLWSEVAAGGGGIGVTVASGSAVADYESINNAVASGNTIINVIGDTIETADIDVGSSGLNIRVFNSAIIDMLDNKFLWSDGDNLQLVGNGKIVFLYTSDDTLFDVDGGTGSPKVNNMDFDNNSAASGYIMNSTGGRISDAIIGGDLLINGTRNIITSCDIGGNLALATSSDNNIVSSCQLDGLQWDLGSGNMLATINIY